MLLSHYHESSSLNHHVVTVLVFSGATILAAQLFPSGTSRSSRACVLRAYAHVSQGSHGPDAALDASRPTCTTAEVAESREQRAESRDRERERERERGGRHITREVEGQREGRSLHTRSV